ncbi:ParB N-terminal domain-containing protein [Aurantimonas endophytica]|uniref:ParB-like N-terminal domain-containing protein n=1 Tax=Aurantimonas endophytica TaxID=1522175 RepID=A0A7W6MQY3_9HYPH|nr:ParB N-terminal domain-containing protein [Aurantimonas endophytica]MBB4004459.1 hypothetical protein [Aurantimonas endophytica]MCO6405295.1 ParB N-terminal domain-containing protein [Aurantimonas endophytica]
MMRKIEVSPADKPAAIEPGPAPMLQWIDIEQLVVDDSYQRGLQRSNWTAIRRIANGFLWSRFSPVFVAPIEGGKFAIIDGQHRTHAAAICGFEQVPCQVVQMDRQEQAASFATVNGAVTKVTLWNIFKAALTAGAEWAVACDKVCRDADCRLMTSNAPTDAKKAGEIFAIALVRDPVQAGHGASVTLALSGVRRSEFGQDAEAYNNEILKPLIAAVCDRPWLAKAGVDLAPFMDEFDIWAALDRAADFAKRKRREGASGISRYDIAAAEIGEGLDRAFPQRMALPKIGAAA